VGVAVVLRDGHSVAERELRRDYVAGRLVHFKVPRKVVFLDEIPKGPTGKLQRIGWRRSWGYSPRALRFAAAGARIQGCRGRALSGSSRRNARPAVD
jgi:hypothetical protein